MAHSYCAPQKVEELVAILAEKKEKAKIWAGGTDLAVELRDGKLNNNCFVALTKIAELKGITLKDDVITIGAMTTHSEVEQSPIIRARALVLAQAAASVGSPQIRNAGTIGGNIANASPAADTPPALIALDASVTIVSASGERKMKLEDLFAGIGTTKLNCDEIIKEITFKALPESSNSLFFKLARRNVLAISRMSIAAISEKRDGKTVGCRLALGAVAPNAFRARSAEKAWLAGASATDNIERCVEAAYQEICATLGQRASAVYKKRAGKALINRVLSQVAGEI